MALFGIVSSPSLESIEVAYGSGKLLTKLNRHCPKRFIGKYSLSTQRFSQGLQCSFSSEISSVESEENSRCSLSASLEEESVHVVRFKKSDFKILDCVSVGLGGRVRKYYYL